MTALTAAGPGTPMLFQGQEFGVTAPFLYFADHAGMAASAGARRAQGVHDAVAEPATTSRCSTRWPIPCSP